MLNDAWWLLVISDEINDGISGMVALWQTKHERSITNPFDWSSWLIDWLDWWLVNQLDRWGLKSLIWFIDDWLKSRITDPLNTWWTFQSLPEGFFNPTSQQNSYSQHFTATCHWQESWQACWHFFGIFGPLPGGCARGNGSHNQQPPLSFAASHWCNSKHRRGSCSARTGDSNRWTISHSQRLVAIQQLD